MNETIAKPDQSLLSFKIQQIATWSILLLAVGAFIAWQLFVRTNANRQDFTIPTNPEIEERFGVRFTFIALTADGGLVDLRYKVIDEGKAKNFGHYTETSPMILVEDTGTVIDVTRMGLHNHRVEQGRIYYILFRNSGNAIRPGDKVTLAIDDLAIKHITVR